MSIKSKATDMNVQTARNIPRENIDQVIRDKGRRIEIYFYHWINKGEQRFVAKGFVGRKTKPSIYTSFIKADARAEYVANWMREQVRQLDCRDAKNSERKLGRTEGARKGAETIKVGDLFCSTISYSMTLNTFYQIVEKTGRNVVVVEAPSETLSGGGYSGKEVARRQAMTDDMKRLNGRITGSDCISINGRNAYLTTEKEEHYYNTMD